MDYILDTGNHVPPDAYDNLPECIAQVRAAYEWATNNDVPTRNRNALRRFWAACIVKLREVQQ